MSKSNNKLAIICLLLVACTVVLCACRTSQHILPREYLVDEVRQAYEKSDDFDVFYMDYTSSQEFGYDYYIVVTDSDENQCFFYFFSNQQLATQFAEEQHWNVALWAMSVLYGEPTWVYVEQQGKMVATYTDASILQQLLQN